MGKQDKNRSGKASINPKKHKQIEAPTTKSFKKAKQAKPTGKALFQIVNQTEGGQGEDAFAALGYNDASEEAQIEEPKIKNKNKFKKDNQPQKFGKGKKGKKAKKEVTPQQSQQIEQEPQQVQQYEEGEQEEYDDQEDIQNDQQQFGEEQQSQGLDEQNNEDQEQIDEQNLDNQDLGEQVDCDAPPQEQEDNEPVDISVINLQIQQNINILMNTTKLGEGKPRKYYIQQLRNLLHKYYGYNFELIDHFLNFFNPAELVQFFQANETQRPLTIRTNTLKTRRKQLAQNLIQRGANLDPLAEWSKVGIKIYESKVPIGATPQYLAGHYMLQSASSFLPVIALDPQVGQRVLDMASAPGGKTTYIAQLMKNTGAIFANDLKEERLKALKFNLYRLGITNTVVTCRDGRKYPSIFPGSFDRVLLDAPCTGLGIISKDYSIKANRVLLDIYKNSHIQKQLILAAIDCAKVGGTIVYSTCSVSPLENEEVVNYALKKRFIKIVDCDIEVGEEGLIKFVEKRYHVDLRKTRRIYPHVHNMDGFYVAKIVKLAKGNKISEEKQEQAQN